MPSMGAGNWPTVMESIRISLMICASFMEVLTMEQTESSL